MSHSGTPLDAMDSSQLIPLGEGNTAEVFLWNDKQILKLFRSGISHAEAQSEQERMQFVQRYVHNAPRVYEIVELDGRCGLIFDRVEGVSLLDTMLSSIDKVKDHAHLLAEIHLKLHQTRIGPAENLSLKAKLTRDIAAAELDKENKASALTALFSLPDGKSLCHLDFHPDNIILQDGAAIIIDWVTVCIGDPAADLARTWLMLSYAQTPVLDTSKMSLLQQQFAEDYLQAYLKLSGISVDAVLPWLLPIAAARLSEQISRSEKMQLRALIAKRLWLDGTSHITEFNDQGGLSMRL